MTQNNRAEVSGQMAAKVPVSDHLRKLVRCLSDGWHMSVDAPGGTETWCIGTETRAALVATLSTSHPEPTSAVRVTEDMVDRLEAIELGARNLDKYLTWQMSPESPGHHPTFTSAVAYFRGQFEEWVFEPGHSRFEERQEMRRSAALSQSQPAPQPDAIADETGTWSDGGKSWDPAPQPDAKASGVGSEKADRAAVLRGEASWTEFRSLYPTSPTEAGVEEPERFDCFSFATTPGARPGMRQSPTGEWVRFSDHNTIVERLKVELGEAVVDLYEVKQALTTERERSARLRNEVLEEAAKVADAVQLKAQSLRLEKARTQPDHCFYHLHEEQTAKAIAAALRELKGGE